MELQRACTWGQRPAMDDGRMADGGKWMGEEEERRKNENPSRR